MQTIDQAEQAERLRKIRALLLAESPLAGMETWARTGEVPPAEELRAYGLTSDSISPQRYAELRLLRFPLTRTYSFAIPCREAVEALKRLAPLVEIGAGSGYWTAVLTAAGGDVLATDLQAFGETDYGFEAARWAPVEPFGAAEAVRAYPERNVFCCWPTEGAEWALEAAMEMRPGRLLAVIGEGVGGHTATEEFWQYLSESFSPLENIVIPQFPRTRDFLAICRKR